MSWKLIAIPAVVLAVAAAPLLSGADLDERIPVGPGGSMVADIALGDALSFDRGSLRIRSHDAEDVRVRADASGWGQYAVQLDLSRVEESVRLVGRVDGPLDWLFGGPRVSVRIWVPRDFAVEARIEGGPLGLEDLAGPITANVSGTESEVWLRGARGPVSVVAGRGGIEIEDVDGDLEVTSQGGSIEVTGVRGSLRVSTRGGSSVDVESVTGPVTVESEDGQVRVEEVRGDVEVRAVSAHIDAEDVQGRVVARTGRGDIQVEDVDGEVSLRTERGEIEVEFEGEPRGRVETGRGDIEIEVSEGWGFALDARTGRGTIELDAGETHGEERLRPDGILADAAAVVREVNGGGPSLHLRTGRGTIRVED